MATVAAIGERAHIQGFALAGVRIFPAEDESDARSAWERLPADVAVVLLTARAARAVDAGRTSDSAPLSVVIPE